MSSTTEASARRRASDICNPFFARFYNYVLQRGSGRKDVGCRRELLAELSGTVIEVGPGNGPNFDLYPPSVERVIAVEPEPFLREEATQAASCASVSIEVVAADAEHLQVEDRSVDAVVLALVLCSVPDQAFALAEAERVLRHGGALRVYEHVVAEHHIPRALQEAAQATFWPRAFGSCHPARDTLAALEAGGFDTSGVRRFVMQVAAVEPPMPYILGRASALRTPRA